MCMLSFCSRFRWDQVGNSIFQRYPNPWSKHVLTEDVISRRVEGPILKTVRLISKTNKLPKIAQKVRKRACSPHYLLLNRRRDQVKQNALFDS